MTDHLFDPDWCIHPGETLREWLEDAKVPPYAFAHVAQLDREYVESLVNCKRGTRIGKKAAEHIAYGCSVIGVGPSAQFWRNLEANYRDGLKRGKTDTSTPMEKGLLLEEPQLPAFEEEA